MYSNLAGIRGCKWQSANHRKRFLGLGRWLDEHSPTTPVSFGKDVERNLITTLF